MAELMGVKWVDSKVLLKGEKTVKKGTPMVVLKVLLKVC